MSVKKITVTALETALKDIMRQTPFEKITVSDITNRCQLNRQTFYYHFADKYALLGQIYKQEIFDPFTDGLTFENWNTHLLQMFETMAADAALYKNAVLHADDEFRRFLFQSAATLFRDAVAKLNLRSGLQVSEEEQHFIADFFAYGITGTVLDWVRGGMRKTPDQLAAQLRHLAADKTERTPAVQHRRGFVYAVKKEPAIAYRLLERGLRIYLFRTASDPFVIISLIL